MKSFHKTSLDSQNHKSYFRNIKNNENENEYEYENNDDDDDDDDSLQLHLQSQSLSKFHLNSKSLNILNKNISNNHINKNIEGYLNGTYYLFFIILSIYLVFI